MTNEEVNKLKTDIKTISDNPLFNMVSRDTILEIVLEKIDMFAEGEDSNLSTEQYKADLQCAYDCGYNCGYADAMSDIAEREE